MVRNMCQCMEAKAKQSKANQIKSNQSKDRKIRIRMSNAGMVFHGDGDVLFLDKSVAAATCLLS